MSARFCCIADVCCPAVRCGASAGAAVVLLAVDPAAAPQQAAAALGAPDAAEEFDANPRSMEAAVANLARFTPDKPAGARSQFNSGLP